MACCLEHEFVNQLSIQTTFFRFPSRLLEAHLCHAVCYITYYWATDVSVSVNNHILIHINYYCTIFLYCIFYDMDTSNMMTLEHLSLRSPLLCFLVVPTLRRQMTQYIHWINESMNERFTLIYESPGCMWYLGQRDTWINGEYGSVWFLSIRAWNITHHVIILLSWHFAGYVPIETVSYHNLSWRTQILARSSGGAPPRDHISLASCHMCLVFRFICCRWI